ncbi:Protein of unknown function [Desulfonispora thiosulfatigenes DSM 11270]|uniref:DUF2634 domain-containing protein n=1 Tax=Desulfonispora thiosulfatigenes DSM 11270 TaxID=656914 RepID=A0A1W1VQX5_DESTI|nr:DUF2634 domain-containing protein [Desulfonispora thiosulfatigenes]SMB95324.1 Protein of unknown function [Desulfonispora thiosulfatigenes DSM 11270]
MKTFKIKNGDIVFDGKDIVLVEGIEEEKQSIERLLSTNIGEWFLNIDFGLDYKVLQGKQIDKERIRMAIVKALSQEDRIEKVEKVEISFDNARRYLKVSFILLMKTGNTINGNEVIPIG